MLLPRPAGGLLVRQHGVVARPQLRQWLTPGQIDNHLRRGWLVTVERGVYRVHGSAQPPEQAAMAAILRARPDARLTGPFVLGLLGFDGFTVRDPFEVLTAPGRRLRGVGFPHRRDPTPQTVTAHVGPLPIVAPTAALVDAARDHRVDDRRLRVAIDHARWHHNVSPAKLRARVAVLSRSDPGARRLRSIDGGDSGLTPESEGERRLGSVLSGIHPPPEPQVWILSYRLDWYWRAYRLGVEYLGSIDHTSRDDRVHDTVRAAHLLAAGVRTLTVTHADLAEASALVQWVLAELRTRASELGLPPPHLVHR